MCLSHFREDGWCIPSPLSYWFESVQEYFPVLSRVGTPESRFWVCWKLGGCFYGSPMRGKSVSWEIIWYGCALQSVSDTLESAAHSSIGVKMQDERKERKKGKNPHKTKQKNEPHKSGEKKMQGGRSRIAECGGVSDIPQARVIAFHLGGACSSQARWQLRNPGISWHQKPHRCSPMFLPSASHIRFSLQDCSPCCFPFAGAQGEWLRT